MSDLQDKVLEMDAKNGPKELDNAQPPPPPSDPVDDNVPAIDLPHGWIVVLACFFNLMFSIGTTTIFGVYLQEYELVEFPNDLSSQLSWIGTLQ
ncbi:hypothetical protein LPJ81_004423, partial [Coemansia sp. IMI 209127]